MEKCTQNILLQPNSCPPASPVFNGPGSGQDQTGIQTFQNNSYLNLIYPFSGHFRPPPSL